MLRSEHGVDDRELAPDHPKTSQIAVFASVSKRGAILGDVLAKASEVAVAIYREIASDHQSTAQACEIAEASVLAKGHIFLWHAANNTLY